MLPPNPFADAFGRPPAPIRVRPLARFAPEIRDLAIGVLAAGEVLALAADSNTVLVVPEAEFRRLKGIAGEPLA